MTTALDALPKFSFAGISFPVLSWRVRGGLRKHLHEYPHTPGAALEKLGRRAYEIEAEGIFDQRMLGYSDLWPGDLQRLRQLWESETTAELVIPTLGAIDACCTEWPEQTNPERQRSGVRVSLAFVEDMTSAFVVQQLVLTTANGLETNLNQLSTAAEQLPNVTELGDVFAAGQRTLEAASANDTMSGAQTMRQAQALASLCAHVDATVPELQLAENWDVLYALAEVHASAVRLFRDIERTSVPTMNWTTPSLMSVIDVARILYGDTARAMELMRLNPLDDPMAIPTNTTLLVYQPSSSSVAA